MGQVWVIVAAFNESSAIAAVLRDLKQHGFSNVVVVDDASSDPTGEVAKEEGARVLRHAINRGQGAALQTGIEFALRQGATQLVTFDADGQHQAMDIAAMLTKLNEGFDIVLGSRFLGGVEGATAFRRGFLRVAAKVSNRLSGMALTDAHCGLRAFQAAAAPSLRITQDRMSHASELLSNIQRHKLKYSEVPVTVRYTEYSMRKGQSPWQAISILIDLFFARLSSGRRS
jgi:glycosyltransferase involved in cell wall biosynthesis